MQTSTHILRKTLALSALAGALAAPGALANTRGPGHAASTASHVICSTPARDPGLGRQLGLKLPPCVPAKTIAASHERRVPPAHRPHYPRPDDRGGIRGA
jgi:hypothetical protein